MSFSSSQTFQFPPSGWSLQWYENLFTSPAWSTAIRNSLQVALVTTVLATTLGTAAALGLNRLTPRVRGVATGFLLSPIIIPNILIALVIFSAFLRLSLNGTLIGIAFAHTALALPCVVIALTARLQGMDAALQRAGRRLGEGPFSAFRKIRLTLAPPG